MTTTFRTLLDRVEQGEGSDFELDCRLAWTFGLEPWAGRPKDHVGLCMPRSKIAKATPALTSSIDAAVALIEKVLPNEMPDAIHAAWSALGQQNHWHIALYREGQMKAFPRALLAATLRAKIAQEGEQ